MRYETMKCCVESNPESLMTDLKAGFNRLEFVPIAPKDDREQSLFNVRLTKGDKQRQLFLTIPDTQARELRRVVSKDAKKRESVVQNWAMDSLEEGSTAEPEAVELEFYKIVTLFEKIRDEHCQQLGEDPSLFPVQFATTSKYLNKTSLSVFYSTPASVQNPWDFDEWCKQPGLGTFRVDSVRLVRPSTEPPIEHLEGSYRINVSIGRLKLDPATFEPVKEKKTAAQLAESKALAAQPNKKPRLSAAAQEKLSA